MARLAALLDYDKAPWTEGEAPPLAHWLNFLPSASRGGLGEDGHPRRGGFLPPITLPRRMWAGGRVEFRELLRHGAKLSRLSTVKAIEAKAGSSGEMVFVTLEHEVRADDMVAIVEQQDIVYREDTRAALGPGEPATGHVARVVTPDEAMLFRFSALTFNAHRIHYDARYATETEGYPDLVVQGPLTAILLLDTWLRQSGGARPAAFAFRGKRPLYVNQPVELRLEHRDGVVVAQAANAKGEVAMEAGITPA